MHIVCWSVLPVDELHTTMGRIVGIAPKREKMDPSLWLEWWFPITGVLLQGFHFISIPQSASNFFCKRWRQWESMCRSAPGMLIGEGLHVAVSSSTSTDRYGMPCVYNNRSRKRAVRTSSRYETSDHGMRMSMTPASRHSSFFNLSNSFRYWK